MLEQDRTGQAPNKRTKQGLVLMQIRLQTLCRDYDNGTKNLEEFLTGIGENIRLGHDQVGQESMLIEIH